MEIFRNKNYYYAHFCKKTTFQRLKEKLTNDKDKIISMIMILARLTLFSEMQLKCSYIKSFNQQQLFAAKREMLLC